LQSHQASTKYKQRAVQLTRRSMSIGAWLLSLSLLVFSLPAVAIAPVLLRQAAQGTGHRACTAFFDVVCRGSWLPKSQTPNKKHPMCSAPNTPPLPPIEPHTTPHNTAPHHAPHTPAPRASPRWAPCLYTGASHYKPPRPLHPIGYRAPLGTGPRK
jgi:hypothetical protein